MTAQEELKEATQKGFDAQIEADKLVAKVSGWVLFEARFSNR